jgi:hypothetical protein
MTATQCFSKFDRLYVEFCGKMITKRCAVVEFRRFASLPVCLRSARMACSYGCVGVVQALRQHALQCLEAY